MAWIHSIHHCSSLVQVPRLISETSRAKYQGGNRERYRMYNFRRNYSLSASSAPDERSPMKVLITGSGGKTGCLVLKKLLEKGDAFSVRGLVRTEQSAGKLANETNLSKDSIFVADVTQGPEALAEAMSGCEAVVLCTSAVPKLILWSLFPVLLSRLTGKGGVRPRFRYAEGQSPEAVDWVGARAQIDAAAAAGARKFVFLGSMGGTQTEENFLNTMGGGNVLLWKRKAEEHLIRSGLDYTIIHAGRLTDDEGGKRDIVLGVDDELIAAGIPREKRETPRADFAELAVQSLLLPEASNRSVDMVTRERPEGSGPTDFRRLFEEMRADCDYSISGRPPTI